MANTITIKTNSQFRHLVYRADVPTKVLADQFDYQDADDVTDGFFKYNGHWYHLDGFMRTDLFPGWDAYAGDSAFSGVLIKLSRDGEAVKVGTYYA